MRDEIVRLRRPQTRLPADDHDTVASDAQKLVSLARPNGEPRSSRVDVRSTVLVGDRQHEIAAAECIASLVT